MKLLGYYNYTVILTYIGMIFGFVGIVYAFDDQLLYAIICLLMAGVCDMFDGTIASTMDRSDKEKCFGIQIDSLSDLICFGVLPSAIVYSLSENVYVCAFYVLCALIRLAYFNVDEQERQKNSSSSREIYYGLPVTSAALIVPILYGIDFLFPISLGLMGIFFLTPIQIRKPNTIGKLFFLICGICVAWVIL